MVTQETDSGEPFQPRDEETEARSGFQNWLLRKFWYRIPEKYRQNVEPEILSLNLLPEEEKQIEIRLAWYRELISNIVFGYFIWIFVASLVLTALFYLGTQNSIISLIPAFLLLLTIIEGAREYIEFHQWRLIKTNKRLIISLPQQGAWPLVDNIEMGDLPKVIDTNWSPNPIWRIFQFFTGARDVYISLTAFKFEEGTARVRDALIIPDIMASDVFKLKELVFNKK